MQLWRRKFKRNLQDYGLVVALSKSFAYLFKFGCERVTYRLYKIEFSETSTEHPAELEGLVFRFLNPTDEVGIRQIEENSEWLMGSVKQRLEAGALCLAAFEGDQLAGFNLVSFGDVFMPLVHLSRHFRHDEAWSEHIATAKTFRKRGLASQLRYRIFEELRRRGIRKFYGGALRGNDPSLKLARRVGFQEFVEIQYTRLFTKRKWRYVRMSNEST
jgi:GNAT superfamily N-acetyltransferase